jgi:beta-carotene hydroxylase
MERSLFPLGLVASLVISIVCVALYARYCNLSISPSREDISGHVLEPGTVVNPDPTSKVLPKASRSDLLRPEIAWPTLALLFLSLVTWCGSMWLYLSFTIGPIFACGLSTFSSYWCFTVMHDAVHMSIAPKWKCLNDTAGVLAGIPLLAPFGLFKFIHLTHHRFSGDHDSGPNGTSLDPDEWAGRGHVLLLPLRWATVFFYYIYWFFQRVKFQERGVVKPSPAQRTILHELNIYAFLLIFMQILIWRAAPAARCDAGIVCWVIPQLISTSFLMYLFDYVPHRPHVVPYRTCPYRSTNATSFLGSVDGLIWTSAALSQNLHIVHHIWPFMPFYSYRRLWRQHGAEMQEKGCRIVPLIVNSREVYFEELQKSH